MVPNVQYHKVKINVNFRPANELVVALQANGNRYTAQNSTTFTQTPVLQYASLWVDYVYLDTDERRRFAQLAHEYLIDQLQVNNGIQGETLSIKQTSVSQTLNFNHPVKELIWVLIRQKNASVGTAYIHPFNFRALTCGSSNTNWLLEVC